jgi:long-chain acyl-CoA synthetase
MSMQLGALGQALTDSAAAYGARPAVSGEGTSLTFSELRELAAALASSLVSAGIASNEPVLVRVSNHPADFAAFLAVWLAGGVVVPVHRSSPPGAVAQVQTKARARFEVELAHRPGLAFAIRPGGPAGKHDPPGARPILADAAFVIFTSGSTGAPKGAVLSHRAFAGKLRAIQSMLEFSASDRVLLVLNNTFSFGIWVGLLTLLRGGLLVTRPRFESGSFIDVLAAERVSRVGVVPSMMRALFAALDAEHLDIGTEQLRAAGALRHMLIGGEPLGSSLSSRLRQFIAPASLIDIYGLTETSTCDFFLSPEHYLDHPHSIGRAAPGVQFRIVDDAGADLAAGAVGELLIRSPYLMAGYLDDPELTQAAFRDGWLRTGDQARSTADGFVELTGRKKDLIVRGGNKIAPQELEQTLCAYPGVAAALAVGVDDAILGQRIHVLLVPAAAARLQVEDLRQFLRERLDRYKQPDSYYIHSELPTGRTGKLDRGRLRDMIMAGELQPVAASR